MAEHAPHKAEIDQTGASGQHRSNLAAQAAEMTRFKAILDAHHAWINSSGAEWTCICGDVLDIPESGELEEALREHVAYYLSIPPGSAQAELRASSSMRLRSIGAGVSPDEAVVLWVAGDADEHRRVAVSQRLAFSLMRQVATILEQRS